MHRAAFAAALVAAAATAPPALAQGICDGRPIRAVWVVTAAPFSRGDSAYAAQVRSAGNVLHWRTREDVVRGQLLFGEGEPCDSARLAETERVLRALPYIREARITTLPVDSGGLFVFVRTRDEWSLRVDGSIHASDDFPLRRLRLVDENLLGRGIRGLARYDLSRRRPAWEFGVRHHRFLGPLEAQVQGGRSIVGPVAEQHLLRPFVSEYDRTAWRESARWRREPFELRSPAFGPVDQPVLAASADVGVAVRGGRPGGLVLAGAAVSWERLLADGAPVAPEPAGDSAAAAALAGRFEERRRLRLHFFAGARALRFRPYVGLDAVRAVEDVREGVELGAVVGHGVSMGEGLQRDWFFAGEAYYGVEAGAVLAAVRGKAEGRYLASDRRWDGLILHGQVLVYNLAGERAVVVLNASVSGGWSVRTPFQLSLGGLNGIRGYGQPSLPVGRRLVIQGEHRWYLGAVAGVADVGTAAFVDLGRGWAGDAAFGEDTGLLAALGAGLRFAVPRGSPRTYRLDLAVPLMRGRGPELQLAVRQQFGLFRGEPDDVARSREQVSSTTVFNFPRY